MLQSERVNYIPVYSSCFYQLMIKIQTGASAPNMFITFNACWRNDASYWLRRVRWQYRGQEITIPIGWWRVRWLNNGEKALLAIHQLNWTELKWIEPNVKTNRLKHPAQTVKLLSRENATYRPALNKATLNWTALKYIEIIRKDPEHAPYISL